eukprot:5912487-Karenia_brevis.AAC.1
MSCLIGASTGSEAVAEVAEAMAVALAETVVGWGSDSGWTWQWQSHWQWQLQWQWQLPWHWQWQVANAMSVDSVSWCQWNLTTSQVV